MKKPTNSTPTAVILAMIVSGFLAFGYASANNFGNGFRYGVPLGVGFLVFLISYSGYKKQMNEYKRALFFEKCKKAHISALDTPAKVEKAKLIAKEIGLRTGKIEDYYEKEKKNNDEKLETEKQATKERERITKREKEQAIVNAKNRYTECEGREKRIKMLQDQKNAVLAEAEKLEGAASTVYNSSQQKELSWGWSAGIANGLGGPVAGMASVLDTEIQNAQIRAENQANLQRIAPALLSAHDSVRSYRNQAEELEKKIKESKTKVVMPKSQSDAFSKLVFSNVRTEVNRITGTISVFAKVTLAEPLTLYEGVKGVVDGTVRARVFDGEKLAGCILISFPLYGVSYSKSASTACSGMCICNGDPDKNYRVEFEPYKLWIMEK